MTDSICEEDYIFGMDYMYGRKAIYGRTSGKVAVLALSQATLE